MARLARAAACDATWDKINNRVAWRMADAIEERRRERANKEQQQQLSPSSPSSSPASSSSPSSPAAAAAAASQNLLPLYGWWKMSNPPREAMSRSFTDARLLPGLAIIATFWAVTRCYVLFTECLLWWANKGVARGHVCGSL
ncbi:hypothetical protein E4U41_005132 [Claviceps citrina]|nr:hypothetical protein E4U41_005132 [Claviceps citrina]